VVALVDRAEWLGIPSIVTGELYVGFLAGSQGVRDQEEFAEFMSSPIVEEIPVEREIALLYGEIVHSLRRSGTPLPTNDIWIAAATARVGATLLTYDAHFAAVERIGALILQPADP
jgi:tRNA(fMet)-specific endonuclease VapC